MSLYEKNTPKKALENPIINLIFAGVLIYSSLSEALPTLLEDIKAFNLRSHHGASFFGFWHLVKAGIDLYDGKEQLGKFLHPKKEKDK